MVMKIQLGFFFVPQNVLISSACISSRSKSRTHLSLNTLAACAAFLVSELITNKIRRADLDGTTVLLDLDDARAGDPAVDVGNFVAHLRLRTMQYPDYRESSAGRHAFLDEYKQRANREIVEESFDERARFYEATTLLRLSGVYAPRQQWGQTIPPRVLDRLHL